MFSSITNIHPPLKLAYSIYDPNCLYIIMQLRVWFIKLDFHKFNDKFRDTFVPDKWCLGYGKLFSALPQLWCKETSSSQQCNDNGIFLHHSLLNLSNEELLIIIPYGHELSRVTKSMGTWERSSQKVLRLDRKLSAKFCGKRHNCCSSLEFLQ